MSGNNVQRKDIQNRKESVLNLIRAEVEPVRVERAFALLILEILDALQRKTITLRTASKLSVEIEVDLVSEINKRLSDEFHDLVHDAIIIDEIGTPYGPDLIVMRSIIAKILKRDEATGRPHLKKFTADIKAQRREAKAPAAVA